MNPRLLDKGIFTIKDCRHGCFLYNRNDLFISKALDNYGEWCEQEIETLAPYIPEGGVVLDVGANIGTHALAFAQKVGPAGHVLAFEPQRLIHYMLCANAVLNGLAQLHCLKLAVSDAPGKARIPVRRLDTEFNFGCVSLEQNAENGKLGPSESVDCITVDSLRLARCDVIKVDVEGFEAKVIMGAKDTLKRLRPVLFIENNRPELSPWIYASLGGDYLPFWHIAPYYSSKNFFANATNVFERFVPEANVLCLHRDDPRIKGVKLAPVKGPDDIWERAWRAQQAATA